MKLSTLYKHGIPSHPLCESHKKEKGTNIMCLCHHLQASTQLPVPAKFHQDTLINAESQQVQRLVTAPRNTSGRAIQNTHLLLTCISINTFAHTHTIGQACKYGMHTGIYTTHKLIPSQTHTYKHAYHHSVHAITANTRTKTANTHVVTTNMHTMTATTRMHTRVKTHKYK